MMIKTSPIYFYLIAVFIAAITMVAMTGCANMIPPGGGPRDSLPPVLVTAAPRDSMTNFTGNRVTLNFDEFVEIQNAYENVLVSPNPVSPPIINARFRTVTVRIKDTLEPNTTYSINFGNALRDINEGNIAPNFTYLFSTGPTLDTNSVSGKVVLAQTGKIDTTLVVVLHRNLDDSAVVKERPRYVAKLDGKGNFQFKNIAAGTFAMYAIPNEYSKHYDDTTKPFAFADTAINSSNNRPVTLYAYQLEKIDTGTGRPRPAPATGKAKEDKLLRYQANFEDGRQSLLNNLELTFNKKITAYDSSKITLLGPDSNVVANYSIIPDTGKTRFTLLYKWPENTAYRIILRKEAFADSAGTTLAKNDTIRFSTKRTGDYGTVKLLFKNLDLAKNPVLQIVKTDKVVDSIPLRQSEWTQKLYEPGEYDIRILYDNNKNGKWDPGKFFGKHEQPEIVITANTKLSVRANSENQTEITL
ncbi:Ig-like domain-containing protein [Segetibacter sp.]|jgi:hypothetical protein|uniref:Ig-like domain-containing protein n=1 Tax=Segetibacter sp. TaxID=2231182 RepID=UPI002631243A|nr:Ig-like domain-containing protein [Segetibacter sp.]MCW3081314.1 hypothetical protein [Segetibacter sp.]